MNQRGKIINGNQKVIKIDKVLKKGRKKAEMYAEFGGDFIAISSLNAIKGQIQYRFTIAPIRTNPYKR